MSDRRARLRAIAANSDRTRRKREVQTSSLERERPAARTLWCCCHGCDGDAAPVAGQRGLAAALAGSRAPLPPEQRQQHRHSPPERREALSEHPRWWPLIELRGGFGPVPVVFGLRGGNFLARLARARYAGKGNAAVDAKVLCIARTCLFSRSS